MDLFIKTENDLNVLESLVSAQDKEIRSLEGRRSAVEDVDDIIATLRSFKKARGLDDSTWLSFLQSQLASNDEKLRRLKGVWSSFVSPATTASYPSELKVSGQETPKNISVLSEDHMTSTPPTPREQELTMREIWVDRKMAEVQQALQEQQLKLDALVGRVAVSVDHSMPSLSELVAVGSSPQLVQATGLDDSLVSKKGGYSARLSEPTRSKKTVVHPPTLPVLRNLTDARILRALERGPRDDGLEEKLESLRQYWRSRK